MKSLIIDYEKCNGCNSCALACSFVKTGTFDINRANVSVSYFPEVNFTVPVVCQHCSEPICMEICPKKAIYRDEETNAVIIDQNICTGCKLCIMACPIGAPWKDSETKKVFKCDLCGGDPECVKYCSFGALSYDDLEEETLKGRKDRLKRVARVVASFDDISILNHIKMYGGHGNAD